MKRCLDGTARSLGRPGRILLRISVKICAVPALLLTVLLLAGASCEVEAGLAAPEKRELGVLSWNVQALFDGEESGAEYSDYAGTAGWSAEKYAARLTSIARGISRISAGFPDILALVEIENSQTLRDLAKSLAAEGGGKARYRYDFFANVSGMSLGVGILSKVPLSRQRAHSFYGDLETTPRPVAELWVEAGGTPLVLFVCHWKSKLGGDEATEDLRRASARLILRRVREIEAETPGLPILVLGDLNENHDEYYRQAGRYICALLPDDPRAAEHAGLYGGAESVQTDFLVVSGDKPPRSSYFSGDAVSFYSPWGRELKNGSYFYGSAWETIDHILLNAAFFDGAGWDFNDCEVLDGEPFTDSRGTPNAYNARTGGGLSDHLPLYLSLKLLESAGL
ncbi:MAG: endonuclease/exonuclease/phosphatase family protein [Treponema sp.]|jgi:endonuclease/exonuclease/phosphatase family metal-dependent hydrolase|nr:endonuclease/exonuclease/phosphatase family protein [Treponema sp.]